MTQKNTRTPSVHRVSRDIKNKSDTPVKLKKKKNDEVSLPEDGFGQRVASLRTRLGLTHDGLSNLTKIADIEGRGISRTTIRGYELGTYKPGARELRVLGAALEVTPTMLLLGDVDGHIERKAGALEGHKTTPDVHRWADSVMSLIAFSQLGKIERRQITGLIDLMYRMQIGEVITGICRRMCGCNPRRTC